jgi:integrase
MHQQKITDGLVKGLATPLKGNKITYDTDTKGFGVRVTAAGAKAFVLNYRINNRERRFTIGKYGPDGLTVLAARKKAEKLRSKILDGIDPLADRIEQRTAPTMAELCERFEDEHIARKRPSTQRDYRAIIANEILPNMRHLKVAKVKFADVDALHRKITKRGASYRANRTIAVLSKMFSLSVKWEWRRDNPAKGIERNQESKRHRYLSPDELGRLTEVLAVHEDKQAANMIRLLLLTGARRGEVQSARWADIDVEAGVWIKPGATTKQKTDHRVPLSAPAMQLLSELHGAAKPDAEFVFPGRFGEAHRIELKNDWAVLCKAADIQGARMHDLRHTYASLLASAGLSLPVIGALLGHTQPATTARYSHLFDDPLRAATERVGAIIAGAPSANVVPLKKER